MSDEKQTNETAVTNTADAVNNTANAVENTVPEPVDWKIKYEEAERNRIALQKNLSDREAKLKKEQAKSASIDAINARIDELTNFLGTTLDDLGGRLTQAYDANGTPPKYSEQIKAKAELRKQQQQEINDFVEALTEAGIDTSDPELEAEFAKLTPREALKKLPSFISKRKAKEIMDSIKAQEAAKKEAEREEVKKSGALAMGVKSSSTAGKPIFTLEQIRDRQFLQENYKEILEAQKEGRIKE